MALSLAVPVSAADNNSALQLVQALGIINGDASGNLMLDSNVTRAQFAAMTTNASVYKDSISSDGSGYSLFKDVKSGHWASEYIRLAIQESWMSGYIDGTFRPDSAITLEEACTVLLRLLGYDSSSLAGSFPSAQLNKASALGLRDQINVKQGGVMTRRDCVQLFYNLMTAKTAEGQTYATTLGYTVTNDKVDYNAVVLDNLSGPYVADRGDRLPFTPTTIYRDGVISSSASLSQYDVYYYNEGLGAAWIYTERVAGKITALSPNSTDPTSVTVAGTAYEIDNSSTAYQLSAFSGSSLGDVVTLLLGMDGVVVGVVTGEEVDVTYYGVVESSSKGVASQGNASVETTVTVICTDGTARTFAVDKDASYRAGQVVSVHAASGTVTIKSTGKPTSGMVNKDATKFGNYYFADNVKILDTSDEGNAVTVDPERLAGHNIDRANVRFYALNERDEIEHLILKNVTGDTWTYAYMSSITDLSEGMNLNVTYKYLIDGAETVLQSISTKYPVSAGGVAISYESDGSIRTMRRMTSVNLTDLGVQSAMANNKRYTLADSIQVYLRKGNAYYLTTVSAVNTKDYTLTGWHDTSISEAGGQIRIIVAVEK